MGLIAPAPAHNIIQRRHSHCAFKEKGSDRGTTGGGAIGQGGVGQLPRPLMPECAQWMASWLPAIEIFHLSSPLCSLNPALPQSTTPRPALSTGMLLAGAPRKASLTSLPTSLCSDDNECLRDPCLGKGRCVNHVGSYSCLCYPGYTPDTSGTTQGCQGKPLSLGWAQDPTESVEMEVDPGTLSQLCSAGVQGPRGANPRLRAGLWGKPTHFDTELERHRSKKQQHSQRLRGLWLKSRE